MKARIDFATVLPHSNDCFHSSWNNERLDRRLAVLQIPMQETACLSHKTATPLQPQWLPEKQWAPSDGYIQKEVQEIAVERTNFSLFGMHLAVLKDQYNARNREGVDFHLKLIGKNDTFVYKKILQ